VNTETAPVVVRLNAVTFPMTREERDILVASGARIVEIEGAHDAEILARGCDCDALMVVSAYVHGSVIRELSRCKMISRLGTGVDKIDVGEATRRGIIVTNVPNFCTDEVADHTMALLLSAARQLKHFESSMRQGTQPHDVSHMHRLSVQTLGIIGFGRIGRAVAARAAAFGMRILAVDPQLTAQEADRAGAKAVDLDTLLAESDYVCLLCPLTASTRGMLSLREFRKMKPSAVLVNTGRGELVDEADLVTALRQRIIRYAALDVFAGINVFTLGGFPTDHPLFSLENVQLTPHVAAYSHEANAGAPGAQAVVDVLSGRWPQHPVNPEVTPWFPLKRQ
jgi:D-3-phosphoglycerate dehydrogenase